MKAIEAREITEKHAIPLEEIIKAIESDAKIGRSMHMAPEITNSVTTELLLLGYKISKHTDPIGYVFTRIEW